MKKLEITDSAERC